MHDDTPATPIVLRAGGAASRAATLVVVLTVVGAAWWLLQVYGLGRTPFHSRGEPREAIVVQDLVRHGDWILPKRNGEQLPRKPPLFYWLAALASRVHGAVDEASVRFPSAALSGASCLLVAAVSGAFYGPVAGVLSGIALLTSFEWLRAATAARVDMTLTFGLTLSFIALLMFRTVERRVWLVLFYAGAAWATLSKGIPGLAIPVLAVFLLCAVADRSLVFLRRLRPIMGLIAVLAVAGAWYAAAAARGGREFVSIVVKENLLRAVAEKHHGLGHQHSFAYLVVMLFLGLLPWTLLLPSTAIALWRDRAHTDRWDPRLAALLWSAAVFAPYAVASSKRGVYLLPLYPAMAFLIGWWGSRLVHGAAPARWLPRVLVPVGWVLATLLGLLGVFAAAQAIGVPLLEAVVSLLDSRAALDAQPVVDAAGLGLAGYLLVAAAAAVGLACSAARGRWGIALPSLIACLATVILAVRLIILPAVGSAHTRREFAQALRRAVVDPAAVYTGAALDYGTLFYWGEPIPVFDPAAPGEPPPYLLLPEAAWVHMAPALRRQYRRLPGLTIERGTDQGYVAVLQRTGAADTETRRWRE